MSTTADNAAKAYAIQKMEARGLNYSNSEKWSYDDKNQYLSAIVEFRRANPGMFTKEQLAACTNYESMAATELEEFELWDTFATELGERTQVVLGGIAGTVGNTVAAALNPIPVWARWALILGLGAFIVVKIAPYLPTPKK